MSGIHHKEPNETFEQALNALPGGGTLFLEGVIDTYENKIKVSNRHYTKESPLVIDGQGKTVSFQPIDFSDCGWVLLKGVTGYGGMGLNNTVKDAASDTAVGRTPAWNGGLGRVSK